MRYETQYLGTKAENEAKALQDCKDYLGEEIYEKAIRILRADLSSPTSRTYKYHYIRASLVMFLGIEGYWPVRAMVREVLK